jgi:hypothetical protein
MPKQQLCKRIPAATNTHATVEVLLDHKNGIMCFLCGWCRDVKSKTVWSNELLVEDVSSSAEWSGWCVRDAVVSTVESNPVKRRQGGWCEMTGSLGPSLLICQLTTILHGRLWQEDLSAGIRRIFPCRSRCQETASGDCNRLRTLICVSVTCKVYFRLVYASG